MRLRLRSLKALRAQLPLKSMGVRYLNSFMDLSISDISKGRAAIYNWVGN